MAQFRARALAIRFQVRRGDVAQAGREMQVLPSDPIAHPPARDFQ